MKKLIASAMLFAVFVTAFTGCMRSGMTSEEFWNVKESGDFLYYIRNHNAWIVGFSEQGKEKKLIIVPNKLEGYPAIIPSIQLFAYTPKFESENLKLVYAYDSYPFYFLRRNDSMPNLEKVTAIYYDQYIGGDGAWKKWIGESEYYIGDDDRSWGSEIYKNNACFLLNTLSHEDSTDGWHSDLYWADHYEKGQIIDFIPPVPEREGYVFAGWYEDSGCTKIYTFEEPFTVDETDVLLSQGYVKVFYAKWIAE
ncbi:MAG: InlB B-repeat-containing protein [Ruminococcus flavefaciens]|nr:InlB B-repeat-containing protein [Ruminococcus flavefaciens]